MSSFEEIAAEVTLWQERVIDMHRQLDGLGAELENEVMPAVTAMFAGSHSPAALRVIDALAVAYQAGFGHRTAVLLVAEDMRAYLAEM